jgi:hypothetical protein
VVLDDAPVPGAEGADEQAAGQVHQPGAPCGFAALEAGAHLAVITGKDTALGAGVRDQCLVLVEFQLEVITQEPGEALLDLPGSGLRSGEPG